MANYKIEEIEGIDPVLGEKFRMAGITTTDKLLDSTKTKKQRSELAASTGISEKEILRFANMADLFRINGVGREFAELLEAAGVDTVPELAQRNAENLTAKMVELNKAEKHAGRTPTVAEVGKWISEAASLPKVLEY
jgi:predicted flap endonuclease-1-like 5' DNA nuclease